MPGPVVVQAYVNPVKENANQTGHEAKKQQIPRFKRDFFFVHCKVVGNDMAAPASRAAAISFFKQLELILRLLDERLPFHAFPPIVDFFFDKALVSDNSDPIIQIGQRVRVAFAHTHGNRLFTQ